MKDGHYKMYKRMFHYWAFGLIVFILFISIGMYFRIFHPFALVLLIVLAVYNLTRFKTIRNKVKEEEVKYYKEIKNNIVENL